ncbi:MAG: N-acetylmuramoyl-L-alanine amidase [Floccifex sp.]
MKKTLLIVSLIFSIGFVSSFGYSLIQLISPIQQEITTTICIDAGHGGYDSGTIGVDGSYEKDLSLELALQTGRMIQQMDPSIQVIYTRDSDLVSWPSNESQDLESRVQIGQQANYFFSIHLNSNADANMTGYCFYIKNGDSTSRKICQAISDNLLKLHYSSNNGIESTLNYPLYVVDQLSIPSILFEVGYLSNEKECLTLQSWLTKKKICYAISKGIVDQIHKQSS